MTHESRYDTREAKSEKILTILQDFLGQDLSAYICLDVGCGIGAISSRAADYFKLTIGIDLDTPAIQQAVSHHQRDRMQFALASGHEIPFADGTIDVIICAQVYEHSTDPEALAREIYRVLRPGGVCFFSGPNRLNIIEEHYWLPFLSWLPQSLANRYMQRFQRGPIYDAYPMTYWGIRGLWRHFQVVDYTPKIIKAPEKYSLQRGLGRLTFLGRLPVGVLNYLKPIYPNYNWILVKK